MQSVLILTSAVPGLAALSGRAVGEVDESHTLTLPVSPYGTVWLEHRPFSPRFLPTAHRLTFSAGMLMPESLPGDAPLAAVCWPGGQCEVEFLPPPAPDASPRIARTEGGLTLARWGNTLFVDAGDGQPRALTLPRDAEAELPAPTGGGHPCLAGKRTGGGEYLLPLPEGAPILAQTVRPTEGGVEAFVPEGDFAGHGRLETWQWAGDALHLARTELLWADGAPRWPRTPEETALCALQAARLGLAQEAQGYLAPTAECREAFALARESGGAVALPWGMPGGIPCVGLLSRPQGPVLTVSPVAYSAERTGTAQGPWRLTRLAPLRQ